MRILLASIAIFWAALPGLAQVEFQLKNDSTPLTVWFYEPESKAWVKPILLDKQMTATVKLPANANYVVVVKPENEKHYTLGEYSFATELNKQQTKEIRIQAESKTITHHKGDVREVTTIEMIPQTVTKTVTEQVPVVEDVTRIDPVTQKATTVKVTKMVPQTRVVTETVKLPVTKTRPILNETTYDETITTRTLWIMPVTGERRELKSKEPPTQPLDTPPEPEFK